MIVEFGNEAARNGIDDRPKVTTVHVPEGDGGYSHEIGGVTVDNFRMHRQEAADYNNGVTHLPDHEALLSIVSAWPSQSSGKPSWVSVTPDQNTPEGVAEDVEKFLSDHYYCPQGRPEDVEFTHWTRFGEPGQLPRAAELPNATALYTNAGRVISNVNDGGGQTGLTGTGTAATATTFTTNLTLTTNAWAGYRVYAMQTATGPLTWGNVLSNNNTASASVLTIDRWYVAATPGGSANTTPSAGWYFMLADGGTVANWFVGLTVTNITPAAADTALSGEYVVGTPAGVAAGAGFLRKIAPYTQTSGTSTRSITLVPVFTGNGNDVYPQTFFAIGVFNSMVAGSGGMKFETSLNASATVAASGDNITVTETVNGS
jgi:hypothetical protein